MFNRLTPIVKYLLIANVVMYFISSKAEILYKYLSLYNLQSELFLPFQFISYMFMHGSFWHLFGNMFGLFMFGSLLEQVWGPKRFLIFYFVTGIGAGVLYSGINLVETNRFVTAVENYIQDPTPAEFKHILEKKAGIEVGRYPDLNSQIYDYADHPEDQSYIDWSIRELRSVLTMIINTPMVGASGAIFGILMAFAMLFPNTPLMLLFFPFPIKAKYFVAMYAAYELYSEIQRAPGDNVAHFAHLGGALIAFILVKIWQNDRRKFF